MRNAVFVLVYNEHNPYFNDAPDTGAWPGWPRVLQGSLTAEANALNFTFKAVPGRRSSSTYRLTNRRWPGQRSIACRSSAPGFRS